MMLAPEEANTKPQMAKIPKEELSKDNKAHLSDDDSLTGNNDTAAASSTGSSATAKNAAQKVLVPGAADVLLGRGKPFQSHQGNQLMLQLVDQFRGNYLKADRKGKHIIIEHVLNCIKQQGGRFLMRVDYENYWIEVKRSISYRKVGHAFRSKARRTKKAPPAISPMMKGRPMGPGFMGSHQGLDIDMMGLNSARAAQLGQMMGAGGVSASNPLLRLPSRLPAANQGLLRQQQQQQESTSNMIKEMFAMDRMGAQAQQDALAMRRQLQGMGAFNNTNSNAMLGANAPSMDELFLLERMQGMSQAGSRGQGALNTAGLLSAQFGMLNGGQGRFPNQFL